MAIFFLNSGQILTIENLKKHIILALPIFNIAFWLYIGSQKKMGGLHPIFYPFVSWLPTYRKFSSFLKFWSNSGY
jgi:hypothetical protein